jgi:hypothetical protein
VPIPNHNGFALIGYTNARDIAWTKPTLLHRFFNYLERASDNLQRVVLDPARARENLFVFSLGHRYYSATAIEDHEPSAGRSLVQRCDISGPL